MIVESLLPRLRNSQPGRFSRRQTLEGLHEPGKTGGITLSNHNQMEVSGMKQYAFTLKEWDPQVVRNTGTKLSTSAALARILRRSLAHSVKK